LRKKEKEIRMARIMRNLTLFHNQNCKDYSIMLRSIGYDLTNKAALEDIPFLPAGLFKHIKLLSVAQDRVKHTLTSSKTSGQNASKIFVDKDTSVLQMRTLAHLISEFIGTDRLPMLIIDSPPKAGGDLGYSARLVGIRGFSIYGKDITYALDEHMHIDYAEIERFLEIHKGKSYLLFGYTYVIWQYFLSRLEASGQCFKMHDGVLIHGGGWKNVKDRNVTGELFRSALERLCFLTRVHDYYGMVEQTGSIYMACERGYFHCSNFSDLLIRSSCDFHVCKKGDTGIIQTLSVVPHSYPGHSILTEDEGIICGEDDCECGRMGKYFQVIGRLTNSEIRGCSDAYGDRNG
jgi:hypothetical protein